MVRVRESLVTTLTVAVVPLVLEIANVVTEFCPESLERGTVIHMLEICL